MRNGEGGAQMNDSSSARPIRQGQAPVRATAKARITVRTSEAEPYDQTASPALVEVRLTETFTGDIEGESPVRALQVLHDDKSACLVSLQRFRGKLDRAYLEPMLPQLSVALARQDILDIYRAEGL